MKLKTIKKKEKKKRNRKSKNYHKNEQIKLCLQV